VPTPPIKRPEIRFKEFEQKGSPFVNDFDEGMEIYEQILFATNSSIQVVVQKWRNEVSSEEPSPIKTAKQIFISIGFGLNTLFGLIESAAKIALFIIPFLIALAISWATDAEDGSVVSETVSLTAGIMLLPAMYVLQSSISTITNLQTPDQQISYKGQADQILYDQ